MSDISKNLKIIHDEIEQSLRACGRGAIPSVHLVAVSKKQPQDKITQALKAGHRVFGENRVQEAYEHWDDIRRAALYPDLKLHLIGALQTNKAKDAVALFDIIETLDREKLAQKLSSEMAAQKRNLSCFIQVNTGEEAQKSGILPAHLPAFLRYCIHDCGLKIEGLMGIPPAHEPPALHFALLLKMARTHNLPHLSMGMSADFKKAIPLGATHIRIGTGVFGDRLL